MFSVGSLALQSLQVATGTHLLGYWKFGSVVQEKDGDGDFR